MVIFRSRWRRFGAEQRPGFRPCPRTVEEPSWAPRWRPFASA
ncbi:hypothetical protein P376_4460 [Streptomyces sp. HCCB10043]|nr:hypothetical protein P376_4460 [Streptomyces sp. HCCB10043]